MLLGWLAANYGLSCDRKVTLKGEVPSPNPALLSPQARLRTAGVGTANPNPTRNQGPHSLDQSANFVDLGLSDPLLDALNAKGYSHPTPIQVKSIPAVLMGRDLIGIAQTGTGKTAAFVLPMIDVLAQGRARARMPRSLIVSPTRELAAQIAENFEAYTANHSLTMALLIGGESMRDQEDVLRKGVDVLIATPGRLLDLFERGAILLNDVQIFVVDEADRMLDMGFIPDIERIAHLVQGGKARKPQTLFFSATMAPEIRRLCDLFLTNPKQVEVARQSSTSANISQRLIEVAYRGKRKALAGVLGKPDGPQCLVFCNRKRDIDDLVGTLQTKGYRAAPLHGDMPQPKRLEKLAAFKDKAVQVLVCSDVAARGIDISDLPLVVNFDVPFHAEDYVHRIGRTGRAGKMGQAVTLASPSEAEQVEAIEVLIGQTIAREAAVDRAPKPQGKGTGLETVPFVFAGWAMDETLVQKAKKVFENHIPAYVLRPATGPLQDLTASKL